LPHHLIEGGQTFNSALQHIATSWTSVGPNGLEYLSSPLGRLARAEGIKREVATIAFGCALTCRVGDSLSVDATPKDDPLRHRAIEAFLNAYFMRC
jgi:hypothetical protein